jgi:spermidine synthase
VVGGGDGGVLRELSRHASLEEIHIAEIDGMVIDVSKKHFPGMAVGFADPRVSVHVCDGIKFVQEAAEGTYDLIVVDSSDPVGPAEVLFQRPFFEYMHRALKPGGVVCTQAESLWYHMDIIKSLAAMCREVFAGGSVQYAYTTIPTYPSGQIGFMVCAKAGAEGAAPLAPREPRQAPPGEPAGAGYPPLRYYNSEVHRAAFTLPTFARDALAGSLSF